MIEYILQGDYGQGWEDLTAEFTVREIRQRYREYQENEGGTYRVVRRREETAMKKSDVELRGYNRTPALNVKVDLWLDDLVKKYRDKDHEFSGNDDGFWSWLEGLDEDAERNHSIYGGHDGIFTVAEEWARGNGWEQAKEDASDIFPQNVKVYSDGRSGGWLIVEGLPDVEEWDAIALGRWVKYARWVKQIVENVGYDFLWQLHVNFFEPYLADEIEFAEIRSKHPRSEWSQIACSLNTELGYEQWLRTLENA